MKVTLVILLAGLVLASVCESRQVRKPNNRRDKYVLDQDDENSDEGVGDRDLNDDDIFHVVKRVEFGEDDPDEDSDEDGGDSDYDDSDEDDEDEDEQGQVYDFPYKKYRKWQQGWRKHPLFIIIIGGLRWDFLEAHKKNLTSFEYLRTHGTTVPVVEPIFPPEDYPSWTTIATGRVPEEHSIVGDYMYDLKNERLFNRTNYNSTRIANWWKHANPFWSTAAKHGRRIAFYNWHDCKLPGATLERPEDCHPYHPIVGWAAPSKAKIANQFDAAFNKLYKKHYHVSVVYTDLIRRVTEKYGPLSRQLYKALHDIDDVLEAKLKDIENKAARGMKMNLMVISDYGMTDTDMTTDIVIEDYIDVDDVQYIIYSSGYVTLVPFALSHEKIMKTCQEIEGADAYLTKRVQDPPIPGAQRIPSELHYGRGEWTQDILLVAKPSFQFVSATASDEPKIISVTKMDDDKLKAGIGFNPHPEEIFYPFIDKRTIITKQINDTIRDYYRYHKFKWDMRTQAFMMGPDFRRNIKMKNPVSVLDFYQLICFLMQVPAEDHQGDWERVEGMLRISGANSNLNSGVNSLAVINLSIVYFLTQLLIR